MVGTAALDAVDALRADHDALAETAAAFSLQEWSTPSSCVGWSVQDVVAHMAQLFRQLVDPASLPAGDPSGSTERTQDRWVEAMRGVPAVDVLVAYRDLGAQALEVLAGLRGNDSPIDLGDLGTHPLHRVANAYSFDHFTHIRTDILGPLGPIDAPAPPWDELRLGPAMDWMLGGLPTMSRDALAWLDVDIELELTGAGGRIVHVSPTSNGAVGVGEAASGAAVARITSSTADFVLWATKRRDWRDLEVDITGDEKAGIRFADAVKVF